MLSAAAAKHERLRAALRAQVQSPAGSTAARRWLGIAFAAAATAGGTLAIDSIVQAEARRFIESEITAVAEQAAINAEAPIAAAAKALAELARSGAVDCLRQTLARFRERANAAADIAAFDLVDANGFLMCSSGGEPAGPAQLLPQLTPRMPPVTLVPDPRPDRRGMLVAWTAATGTRLVAELSPDLPQTPAGPAFAAGRMSIALRVADHGIWRQTGLAGDGAAELLTARAAGKGFPVSAEVAIDARLMPVAFRRIELAILVAGGIAIGSILLLGWFGRLPRPARAAASRPSATTRATPAYRPVVEIGTGTLVGIDLLIEGADGDTALADSHFLDRIFTEAAPILRANPMLKLSLALVTDHDVLERLANTLTRLLPRFSVQPGQVVVSASPGTAVHAGPMRSLEAIRSAGMQLSLDRVAHGEGGGLMALLSHRPDFITVPGDLAGGPGESPEGLTILRAIVSAAHDLGVGVIVQDVAGPEQIDRLRAIGITTATGPAFGPPLKAHSIAALVVAATAESGQRARVA